MKYDGMSKEKLIEELQKKDAEVLKLESQNKILNYNKQIAEKGWKWFRDIKKK